ncbi:unnamed protein product [Cuscuta campestris]|uniref:Uncharacterized protein n=1 Tax=Cuscuta campestris TaxID=132261 RepID=A0A484MEP4_9ASTE|nr:unnamed protein product [Cuscuta campestris]
MGGDLEVLVLNPRVSHVCRNMVHGSSLENGEHEFGMPLLLVLLYVYDGIFLTLTSWMNPNFGRNFMNLI